MQQLEKETNGLRTQAVNGDKSLVDVLRSMAGRVVTIATPESFEDAPVGRTLRSGSYRAKLQSVGRDHVVLVTEFQHKRRQSESEPVKQFVPIDRVKRISLMKSELILHL